MGLHYIQIFAVWNTLSHLNIAKMSNTKTRTDFPCTFCLSCCRILPYLALLSFLSAVFVTAFTRSRMPLPAVTIDQEIKGWTLIGYQVDEGRLARNEPADLKLYWRTPFGRIPARSDYFYHQADNQWVQIIPKSQTLVQGGGFEADLARFFPDDIYGAGPKTRHLVEDERDGRMTMVAVLINSSESQRTSLVSVPIEVQASHLYLQAGWLRSEEGRGYFGREWLPSGKYDYVVGGVTSGMWRHYAQVIQPPVGTSEARIWLLNFDSEGQVYFDEVVFVDLGRVSTAGCSLTDLTSCNPPLLMNSE